MTVSIDLRLERRHGNAGSDHQQQDNEAEFDERQTELMTICDDGCHS